MKRAPAHRRRHRLATHLLENGPDIRTVRELLGHADVAATLLATPVRNRGGSGVQGPLDRRWRDGPGASTVRGIDRATYPGR